MNAVGIDIGGTKIEAQIFDEQWQVVDRKRWDTPQDTPQDTATAYDNLLNVVSESTAWALASDQHAPVGISVAGLEHPQTKLALTANLPASGKPFRADLQRLLGNNVCIVNDCRAMTLSEARLGAGKGYRTVVGLVIGTGIGGGITIDGRLLPARAGLSGEIGHLPLPGHAVARYNLPILSCGCGREGCVETLASGSGIVEMCKWLCNEERTAADIFENKAKEYAIYPVLQAWQAIMAELLLTITLTVDPDVIVLAGGVSHAKNIDKTLQAALSEVLFADFSAPPIVIATGGDATGARGAALAATLQNEYD